MAVPLLTDLLTIPTQQNALDQEVLPELTARGARTTDWITGGVYRAIAYVVALMRVDVRKAIGTIAAAGFEQYAFGQAQLPATFTAPAGSDVTSWAPLVAFQRYGVTQIPASYTVRNILLTNSTGSAYGLLGPGAIMISFPSGNRYVLGTGAPGDTTSITIPANGSVTAPFRSEFAQNSLASPPIVYNDASGSTIALVTASYPGVTATNVAPTFSPTGATSPQVGSGVGTVTPSGSPGGAHNIAIRIDQSGVIGGGSWSVSLDGAAYVSQGAIGTLANFSGTGITITPADNAGSPSFIAGSYFYFKTPGSDITTQGRDIETPQALGARCQGLWPSLAFVKDAAGNWIWTSPTINAYQALALSASNQVVVAFCKTDGTVANQVNVYVAGQGTTLPSSVVATVQAFLNSRAMLTDVVSVLSPNQRAITLGGATIYCKSALLATAQAALTKSIATYLGGADQNRVLAINGLIQRGYLVSLIEQTPGITRTDADTTLTVNAAATDLQLPVAANAYELATWSQTSATAFTWVTS